MAYKALYRTYRPSTFDEVAGQQHIVRTIKNALSTGKIAHAYLFCGPRGTGKTTMAKLLAKALNCEEGIGCQCNHCKNCMGINDGSHPDVIELDAASNNGVDEIRELIDKVKYGTILGRYKVYIIDEVHMLSTGAFNALLKTLEEPPAHVIFVLATTEPNKVLPTILSRCQRYDFSKVGDKDVIERLQEVLKRENVTYSIEALKLITSLADGGMRDALSILDQVIAYSGSYVGVDDILDMFALESIEEKLSLINAIKEKNISSILERFNNYVDKGTDIKRLTDDLLKIFKDLLIYQTSRNDSYLEILTEAQAEENAFLFEREELLEMIDTLMNTVRDYKNVSAINPLFEITLLKLAGVAKGEKKIEKPTQKPVEEVKPEPQPVIKEVEKPIEKPAEQPKEEPVSDTISLFDEPKEEPVKPVILSKDIIVLNYTEKDDHFEIDDELMIDIMVSSKKEIKNELLEKWKNIKKLLVHPELGKAAGMLLDGHPLVANNKILIVEQPLNKVVENINKKENQQSLQDVVINSFGKRMFVYALTRNDSVRLQKRYMDLAQLKRLPKLQDITLEFKGDK